MKKRPWPIVILALLHILAAPGNLIMNAYISNVTLAEKWQEYMMPEYRAMAAFYFLIPIIAGISIYICKRWSFWVYIATILATCASSYYGYKTRAANITLYPLITVILIDLVVIFYFFLPAVRVVYFDPRLRWWESLPRYKTQIVSRWKSQAREVAGEILNFSSGGLFFKSAEPPEDNSLIQVSFEYEGKAYQFKGLAILHSRQNNMGFGLKFQHTPESTRAAAELVRKFDAAGLLMKDRLPSSEDNLLHWLKKVLTTGKGLVPEIRNRK